MQNHGKSPGTRARTEVCGFSARGASLSHSICLLPSAVREDVTRKENEDMIASMISSGSVLLLWLSITCCSWSRARRGKPRLPGKKGGWPPPLRSKESLCLPCIVRQLASDKPLQDTTSLVRWGLSNLTPKDRAKVFLGNALMKWAIKMMRLCERFLGSQTFFFSVFQLMICVLPILWSQAQCALRSGKPATEPHVDAPRGGRFPAPQPHP